MQKAAPQPKAPAAPAPAPAADAIALAAEIDELGALEKEFAPLRAKLSRIDQLRAAIRARYATAPATEAKNLEGQRFVLQLGACGKVSMISMPKLFKLAGAKIFIALASTTLKALGEHVTPDVVAAVVTVEQTGPRTIKTFEKGASA